MKIIIRFYKRKDRTWAYAVRDEQIRTKLPYYILIHYPDPSIRCEAEVKYFFGQLRNCFTIMQNPKYGL